MDQLKDIVFSMGSACASSSGGNSYVLKELGLEEACIRNSMRFSLSKYTTIDEIEKVADDIKLAISIIKNRRINE